jgi:uncharacterized protein
MKALEPLKDLEADSSIEDHIEYLKERNGAEAFIAYFQDYSSTYPAHGVKDRLKYLEELYRNAVSHPDIVGISVSTRPDAVSKAELDILRSLGTHVTVELGLQTINEKDLEWIGRAHTVEQFSQAVELVSSYGFETVAHIILGLPNETDAGIIELARFLNRLKDHRPQNSPAHDTQKFPTRKTLQRRQSPGNTDRKPNTSAGSEFSSRT